MPSNSKNKKKKPITNPARGFATTSIASKQKLVPENDVPENTPSANGNNGTSVASPTENSEIPIALGTGDLRELHELNPEELEKRLEEAELQNFVEKYSAKTQKEASRHATKLYADCRILRAQAQNLPIRNFLPDDSVEQILDLATNEVNHGTAILITKITSRRDLEVDVTAKLWTLQRVLSLLDFSAGQIEDALKYVLNYPSAIAQGTHIWGLEQCLDWLVLNNPENELPTFDTFTGKPHDKTKSDTRAETPPSMPESIENTEDNRTNDAEAGHHETPPENCDVVVSDTESELDPRELLEVYLFTKARLYEVRPDLVEGEPKYSKTRRKILKPPSVIQPASSGVKKLQKRLQKIESDILFDKYEADQMWIERINQLFRENAERNKLQLGVRPTQIGFGISNGGLATIATSSGSPSITMDMDESTSDDDNTLGDLFGAISSVEQPLSDGVDQIVKINTDITIRDFGVWKGLSPRRVLEEACRARDARAKLSYRLLSSTVFSNRHALSITWSKDQDFSFPLQSNSVSCSSHPRVCSFIMQTVSTPDMSQSEAFVSTLALFQIFSMSPKEEKAYLRLPPTWRDLWIELLKQSRKQLETADRENVRILMNMVQEKVNQAGDDDDEEVILTKNFKKRAHTVNSNFSSSKQDMLAAEDTVGQQIKNLWAAKSSSIGYQRMLMSRMNLPMFRFRDAALDAIERNQVTIICGETGCGKSTQMPAFILERELSQGKDCRIYCTEPRRISAITLAQRVSEELGEHKNELGSMKSLVGYAIRLESRISGSTRLVYATTGIVLRMLESQDGFEDVTHIVIDEVHERSIETDFLLIILRTLISKRPTLKVILMSATVNAQRFATYFYGAPILDVPGRTFPVEAKFLEDAIELTGHTVDGDREASDETDGEIEEATVSTSAPGSSSATKLQQYSVKTCNTLAKYDEYRIDYGLILKLIEQVAFDPQYIQYNKAILVFLPGIAEIRRLNDMLGGTRISSHYVVHTLHSSIASEDQQEAFKIPPHGLGKIVLSTNIAETGVTIPDVTCVIDTGKHKEMRFDERRQFSRLIESFISRANAKQRRGRAGRTQQGLCFHLFTRLRHDELMADQQTPEMLRLSLQDLIMRVKICNLGDIQSTLAQALDPPMEKNIRRAIDALIEVGALTDSEQLTPLGHQLSKLPLDPYLGKLVLYGALFGCLDASLTVAAILTSKSPFVASAGARDQISIVKNFAATIGSRDQTDQARLSFKRGDSDLLTEVNAYTAWRRVCTSSMTSEFQFCKKSCLSAQTLANIEDLKSQLFSSLVDARFVSLSKLDRTAPGRSQNSGSRQRRFVQVPIELDNHSDNDELVGAIIAWSFYPKLLARDGKGWRNVATNQAITLHPTSIVRNSHIPAVKYLSFYSILQSSGGTKNYNANSLTPVSPLALVLLAGDAVFHPTAHVVSIDSARLRFAVDEWKVFFALKFFRRRLEEIVECKWKRPESALPTRLVKWQEVWNGIVQGWGRSGS